MVLEGIAIEGVEDLLYAGFLLLKNDWQGALAWLGAVLASAWSARKLAAGVRRVAGGVRGLVRSTLGRLFGGLKKRRERKLALATAEADCPVVIRLLGKSVEHEHCDVYIPECASGRVFTRAKQACRAVLLGGKANGAFLLYRNTVDPLDSCRVLSAAMPGTEVRFVDATGKTVASFRDGAKEVSIG